MTLVRTSRSAGPSPDPRIVTDSHLDTDLLATIPLTTTLCLPHPIPSSTTMWEGREKRSNTLGWAWKDPMDGERERREKSCSI